MDPQEILKLLAEIPVTSEEPTEPPKYKTSMKFYFNGKTYRLYAYFHGDWHPFESGIDLSDYLTIVDAAAEYQTLANLSTDTDLGDSDTLYPSQNAVKEYVDAQVALAKSSFVQSDDLLFSTTTTAINKTGTAGTPAKFMDVTSPVDGALRIKWQGAIAYDETGYMRVYVNGSAVGSTKTLATGGNATEMTDNISGIKKGDKIEIYGWSTAGARSVSMSAYSGSFANGKIMAVYGKQFNWTYATY